MSSRRNEQAQDDGHHEAALLGHAHDAAELGDRWFLTATHGVRRVSRWARRELGVLGDSAKAAWHTTARVGNMMVPGGKEPPGTPDGEPEEDEPAPDPYTGPGWTGVDVRSATPVGEAVERSSDAPPPDRRRDDGAPKLPLVLRLLGQLVSEYGAVGYEALEDDPRFWKLVSLLQAHNPRNGRREAPPARRARSRR